MKHKIHRYTNPALAKQVSVGLGDIVRIDTYEDSTTLVWRSNGNESPPYADVHPSLVHAVDAIGPVHTISLWPVTHCETSIFGCVECGAIMSDDDCGPDMHSRPCSKSLPRATSKDESDTTSWTPALPPPTADVLTLGTTVYRVPRWYTPFRRSNVSLYTPPIAPVEVRKAAVRRLSPKRVYFDRAFPDANRDNNGYFVDKASARPALSENEALDEARAFIQARIHEARNAEAELVSFIARARQALERIEDLRSGSERLGTTGTRRPVIQVDDGPGLDGNQE